MTTLLKAANYLSEHLTLEQMEALAVAIGQVKQCAQGGKVTLEFHTRKTDKAPKGIMYITTEVTISK